MLGWEVMACLGNAEVFAARLPIANSKSKIHHCKTHVYIGNAYLHKSSQPASLLGIASRADAAR